MSQTTSVLLPSGQQLFTRVAYTSKEQAGVTFLVFVSILSLIAVIGLLGIISLSAFRTRWYRREEYLFVRTPVAAYFVSLLCCEFIQAIGSLYNGRWIRLGAVQLDQSCTTQGIFKQAADVGTAMWSLAIALHTFSVLALQVEPTSKLTLFGTLIAGWSGICAIVICGPAVVNTAQRGPFFGILGSWCSISNGYLTSQITLDYLFMFIATFFCFVIHLLVYLRLRGYITLRGWGMSFNRHAQQRSTSHLNDKAISMAKQMSLYTMAYSVMIFPIAIIRIAASNGQIVSFAGTVFCETVILLSGCVNVVLFCITRQILPPESIILMKRPISKSQPQKDIEQASASILGDTSMTVVECEFIEEYAHEDQNLDMDSNSDESSTTIVGYGFSERYQYGGQNPDVALEKSTDSNDWMSESSTGVSVLPTRKTVRRPRPPSVLVPMRRRSSVDGLDQFYDIYSAGHLEPSLKTVNRRTNGPSTH